MDNDTPKAKHSGSFMLGGVEMKCHVLEDGRAIIEKESLEKLFDGSVYFTDDEAMEFIKHLKTLGEQHDRD